MPAFLTSCDSKNEITEIDMKRFPRTLLAVPFTGDGGYQQWPMAALVRRPNSLF